MKSAENKQERLVNTLLFQLYAGELSVGDRLPSERIIGELNHVSRVTVRLAVDALVKRGTLERRGRRGIFVKAVPGRSAPHKSAPDAPSAAFVYYSSMPSGCASDSIFAPMFTGMSSYLGNAAFCSLKPADGCKTRVPDADAYILAGNALERRLPEFESGRKPLITIDTIIPLAAADSVSFDCYGGGWLAAFSLAEKYNVGKPLFLGLVFDGEKYSQPNIVSEWRGVSDFCVRNGLEEPALANFKASEIFSGRPEALSDKIAAAVKAHGADGIVACEGHFAEALRRLAKSFAAPVVFFCNESMKDLPPRSHMIVSDRRRLGFESMRMLEWRLANPYADFVRQNITLKLT